MNDVEVVLYSYTSEINGNAPLTLTLNPSGYDTNDGAVMSIEYDFGDGTDPVVVNRKLNVTSPQASAYAFQDDLGDPRNIKVSHNYFPSVSGNPQRFMLNVNVTRSHSFAPTTYTVPVDVYKIDAINGLSQGYFEDIHLISGRCYGPLNEKLLVFETSNPRYITFINFNDNITTNIAPISALPNLVVTYIDSQYQPTYVGVPNTGLINRTQLDGDWSVTFKLTNSGNASLYLGNMLVTNSPGNVSNFSTTQPSATALNPGDFVTFVVSAVDPAEIATLVAIVLIHDSNNQLIYQVGLDATFHSMAS